MSQTTNKRLVKKIKKHMTDHLRMLADHKFGSATTVLNEGKWFEGRADSHDYKITDVWRKNRHPETKECYYNAQKFCMNHAEGRYFEGYAFWCITCVPHAWVVMPDGKVIDFTWEALSRKLHEDTSESVYFGVEVSTPDFCKVMTRTGMWGPVLAWLDTQDHQGSNAKGHRRKAA